MLATAEDPDETVWNQYSFSVPLPLDVPPTPCIRNVSTMLTDGVYVSVIVCQFVLLAIAEDTETCSATDINALLGSYNPILGRVVQVLVPVNFP